MRCAICVCVRSCRNISFAFFLNQDLGFRKFNNKRVDLEDGLEKNGGAGGT